MDIIFDIAGTRCVADHVQMRGNTLHADFSGDAQAPLADAFDSSQSIAILNLPSNITYSVQTYRSKGTDGCSAVFSINSATGRVLH
ncbi:MAG: hypothetical protein ACJAVM_000924 [Sulfitobacter sp.]|jgi:hypothetical protein